LIPNTIELEIKQRNSRVDTLIVKIINYFDLLMSMKKKEVIESRVGSFKDFEGNIRQYVVVALSELLPEEYEVEDGVWDTLEYPILRSASYDEEVLDYITKRVSIGFAVCSATDKFNEKLGIEIATGKARKRPTGALYVTEPGMINSTMVNALLEQEMKYFEMNPGHAIAGYDHAKEVWDKKQSTK
jgi:hypothetical protein